MMALGRTQEKMQTVQVSMQERTLLRSQGDAQRRRRAQTRMQREHTCRRGYAGSKTGERTSARCYDTGELTDEDVGGQPGADVKKKKSALKQVSGGDPGSSQVRTQVSEEVRKAQRLLGRRQKGGRGKMEVRIQVRGEAQVHWGRSAGEAAPGGNPVSRDRRACG